MEHPRVPAHLPTDLKMTGHVYYIENTITLIAKVLYGLLDTGPVNTTFPLEFPNFYQSSSNITGPGLGPGHRSDIFCYHCYHI